jgi:hypothetical protein
MGEADAFVFNEACQILYVSVQAIDIEDKTAIL